MNFQPDTTIRLCATDLMLGNGHQILFDTIEEQTQYFIDKVKYTFDEQTYQRVQAGIMYLDINVETLNTGVNYIMFQNKNYSYKWFYANILKLSYVNPNTTRIDYALDSFQTFMFDVNYSRDSYIDRRHYSLTNDGFDKLMTLPYEDLDVGNQYVICDVNKFDWETKPITNENFGVYDFYLLISTKEIGNVTSLSAGASATTEFQYIVNGTATSTNFNNSVMTGLRLYVINYKVWQHMVNNKYWTSVTFNGTLQQVIKIPFGEKILKTDLKANTAFNLVDDYNSSLDKNVYRIFDVGTFSDLSYIDKSTFVHETLEQYISSSIDNTYIDENKEINFNDNINSSIKGYMMRYPYSVIELNDFRNNITSYHIDNLLNGKPYLLLKKQALPLQIYCSLGSTMTCAYQLEGYKNIKDKYYIQQLTLDNNYFSFLAGSFNMYSNDVALPVVSDYQNAFLQANQNQINAQRMNLGSSLNVSKLNANASLQTGQLGANLSYQNSQIGADTQMANAQINGATALTNAGLSFDNAMGSIVNSSINSAFGMAGNLASGNVLGAVGNVVTGASNAITNGLIAQNNLSMSQNSVNAMLQTSTNSASAQMLQAQNSLISSQAILNTNYANTLRNANLEYQSSIRTLNARIEDINNMPDTVQQLGSGSLFNYLYPRNSIVMTTKTLPSKVLYRLSNYFMLYGFKSNSFESVQSIIDKFTTGCFIKTVNANLYADIPQENLREIIKLFDNGVMLWKGASNFLNWKGVRDE